MFRRVFRAGMPLLVVGVLVGCSDHPDMVGDGLGVDSITLQTFFERPSRPSASDEEDANIVQQTLDAADNTPIAGSDNNGGVSQISGSGVTAAPEIMINRVSGEETTFSISLPATATVTYGFDTTTEAAGTGANENLEQGGTGAEQPGEAVGFTQTLPASGTTTGTLYVYVKTDTPNSIGDGTDYLAYGFWIHDPVGTGDTDIPEIGVFVDSPNSVFAGTSVTALTGMATYAGNAEGLYHEEVAGVSAFSTFTADASLTADFRDADALGTVAGTITSFVGLPTEFDGLEVELKVETRGQQNIRANGDASFVGITSISSASEPILDERERSILFAGTWGGKFYDDTDDANLEDHPGTVAGTFGLQSAVPDTSAGATSDAMNRRALLGIFWGDLQ